MTLLQCYNVSVYSVVLQCVYFIEEELSNLDFSRLYLICSTCCDRQIMSRTHPRSDVSPCVSSSVGLQLVGAGLPTFDESLE